jgi:hypothetical protein
MNNFREILLQILETIGLREWKDGMVDAFLDVAQTRALLGLIEALPDDKLKPVVAQFMSPDAPGKGEAILEPYYTREHMRKAVIYATKTSIAKVIVEPQNPQLTPAQREHILALLDKLRYLKEIDS